MIDGWIRDNRELGCVHAILDTMVEKIFQSEQESVCSE
jgi:hypothetical protein